MAAPPAIRRLLREPAIRRLLRELSLSQREPSWGVAAAPVSDSDLFVWHCNVAGHPPRGGPPVVLHLELTFSDEYPVRPPRVEVLGSAVRHPNVFSTFICLDMLEGGEWATDEERRRPYSGWSSAYSILAILRQLQTFFFEGDGTRWWACTTCTLHNPIKNRRCEACNEPRGQVSEIGIEVVHREGFRCRCGHSHNGPACPRFPDPIDCDDAPGWAPPPDGCPDDCCVICLGDLVEGPTSGPLRGSPNARPLAQLGGAGGECVCAHWFHLPCARELQAGLCPLCRVPFSRVLERENAAFGGCPPCGAVRISLPSAARARMARLAEWPTEVVVVAMTFLRRPERASLVGAVPVWSRAAEAPAFWELQELQCFHEKKGPDEDVIGIGVLAEGRGRLSKLTAYFDAVSLTAWNGGLRRAAWKEPMTHWLPLFVHQAHAAAAAPLLQDCLAALAACAPQGENSHLPPEVLRHLSRAAAPQVALDAVVAIPQMMHELLKQVLYGDRHASLKLLKGYFVMHRLLLHCCEQWPGIRDAVDSILRMFISLDENRTKQVTPWLACFLQLLTVSNVGWDEIKVSFLEECLAREVQFTRRQYPNYRPVSPDAEPAGQPLPQGDWVLSDGHLGSDREAGSAALETAPGVWQGPSRGWCSVQADASRAAQRAFSVRVRNLPPEGVVRVGWATADGDELVGATEEAWGFHASPCFGPHGWKAHGGAWQRYGRSFGEGDLVTACLDRGAMSFRLNGESLGTAFQAPPGAAYCPAVALKRGATAEMLPLSATAEDLFASPEQHRDMAWDANRRGNTLVMFQVYFFSLVRPRGQGPPDWARLCQSYDAHLGFPAPELSGALFGHFAEVHRVRSMRGREAWPLFLDLLGFEGTSAAELDGMLAAAYERATRLNYKQGGRHDHA